MTRRSIARQPIYAALGVPELWRLALGGIECLLLSDRGRYAPAARSRSFPFLVPADLWPWVQRLRTEDDVVVLPEFVAWTRGLA